MGRSDEYSIVMAAEMKAQPERVTLRLTYPLRLAQPGDIAVLTCERERWLLKMVADHQQR